MISGLHDSPAMGILRLAQRPQYPPDQDRRGEERNPGDNQSTCHRMPQLGAFAAAFWSGRLKLDAASAGYG